MEVVALLWQPDASYLRRVHSVLTDGEAWRDKLRRRFGLELLMSAGRRREKLPSDNVSGGPGVCWAINLSLRVFHI